MLLIECLPQGLVYHVPANPLRGKDAHQVVHLQVHLGRPPTGLPRSRSTFAHMRSKRSVLQMHSTSNSVYVLPRIQVWSWREELSEQVLKLICRICHCAGFWAARQCGGPRSAMFSYNSQGASKNFLQVRFLKFWISFSTTTPIAQAFEQNDSVEEFLL